ncbi:MAG: Rieske 2Fe-2S domain-containing protein [Gammaproteobacteria bacterium]
MSKALDYLSRARPDAMDAYFSFLRANGSALDPKTRALISIITKVANQTEAGLRQYARKAVRDGTTPDEILDAIMMAFPALGLTKTVWAVDVLLECGVLADIPQAAAANGEWHDVCAADQPQPVQLVECDERPLFVVYRDATWRAFEARCPHHGTNLSTCRVQGGTVECPLHGWRFDLNTGACIRFGTENLHEFPVRVDGRRVLAQW